MPEFKPYVETSEEVLRIIHLRTDSEGLSIIREGLFHLAGDARGLDEDVTDVPNMPRQAEELLVTLPSSAGGRRSPEQRLRENIRKGREQRRSIDEGFERLTAVLAVVEKELPDVVAAARERVNAEYDNPVGDTVEPEEELKEIDLSAGDTGSVDETAQTTPVASQPQAVGQP